MDFVTFLLITIPISWSDVQDQIESFLGSDIVSTGLAVLIGISVAGMIIQMVKWAFSR